MEAQKECRGDTEHTNNSQRSIALPHSGRRKWRRSWKRRDARSCRRRCRCRCRMRMRNGRQFVALAIRTTFRSGGQVQTIAIAVAIVRGNASMMRPSGCCSIPSAAKRASACPSAGTQHLQATQRSGRQRRRRGGRGAQGRGGGYTEMTIQWSELRALTSACGTGGRSQHGATVAARMDLHVRV